MAHTFEAIKLTPEPVAVSYTSVRALQRTRATTAVRLVLVLPQLVVLLLLKIAAGVQSIYVWCVLMRTNGTRQVRQDFIEDTVGYAARVLGYLSMLTDVYPPFALKAPDYPIGIAFEPGAISRPALLGRVLLIVPCALLSGCAFLGSYLLGLVLWVTGILMGRSPEGIYDAMLAINRYTVRMFAFALLVTPTFPYGLLGDKADSEDPSPLGLHPDARIWICIVTGLGALMLIIRSKS